MNDPFLHTFHHTFRREVEEDRNMSDYPETKCHGPDSVRKIAAANV
uniref:Uncharacterized protein n=1 Tax=Anguilla anguilla TaxID=7936 RepID=A0A0E9QRR3_ANGAN